MGLILNHIKAHLHHSGSMGGWGEGAQSKCNLHPMLSPPLHTSIVE